jgi:hypothetical protein
VTTKLKQRATGELVDAELHTKLELGDLLDAESAWMPRRFGMIKQLHTAGVPQHEWPQHWHWNWVHKLLSKGMLNIGGALSPLRLMGVKCDDTWQGLVLATCVGHQTRTAKGGKDLLYLKYLETAPWNLAVEEIGQKPVFSGVGWQLLELAVRLSEGLDFRGRIGLHALPQAEGFYKRCGMTDLGKDRRCENLRYFEMTEEQANAFLNPGRTTR